MKNSLFVQSINILTTVYKLWINSLLMISEYFIGEYLLWSVTNDCYIL